MTKLPPKGSRFYVATKGKTPGTISLIKPGHTSLTDARAHRARLHPTQPTVTTAIYKITWGLKPEYIEGVILVPKSDLK